MPQNAEAEPSPLPIRPSNFAAIDFFLICLGCNKCWQGASARFIFTLLEDVVYWIN